MYGVRAVRLANGEKSRHFVGSYENESEAKHLANCFTPGNADYAYVKDFDQGTIFLFAALTIAKRP